MAEEHPEELAVRSESERYLFAAFTVGEEIAHFLRTDTGRYLQGLAEQEIAEACRAFLDHDLERNRDVVVRAQVKAMRARQSFLWMLEAIEQGRAAEHTLRELDDHERP